MPIYEYAVVPAPRQAPRVRGVKGTERRFAHGLTELLNTWAAEGWEFLRAESLPCEERSGLFGKARNQQTILVFRRDLREDELDTATMAETAATPEELARELETGESAATSRGSAAGTAGSREPRLSASRDARSGVTPPLTGADRRGKGG